MRPLPPPALGAVDGQGGALDIAPVGHGDHHFFVGDQVLGGELPGLRDDLGAAPVPITIFELLELLGDQSPDLGLIRQYLLIPGDGGVHFLGLGDDLLAFETGKPLQPHIKNGLGLDFAQREAGHQLLPGCGRVGRGLDQGDDFIQVLECHEQPRQDVGPLFGPGQIIAGAPDDHFLAVLQEMAQHIL